MRKTLAFLFLLAILAGGIPAVSEARVQSDSGAASPATVQASNSPIVSKNLYYGIRNSNEVMALQSFLANRGYYDGPVTGNFFGLTLAAVKKFQKANDVPPTGYFGPISRKVINNLASGPLVVAPASPVLAVGENIELKAYYQPPMPPCPEGMFCAQVMPAPIEVEAEWSSTDPSIARVEKQTIYCITTPCPPQVRLHGERAGEALVVATYARENGAKISAVAFVRVNSRPDPVTGGTLEIVPASLDLKTGEKRIVEAWYTPPLPPCARATSGPICMIAVVRMPALAEWTVLNPSTGIVASVDRPCANSVSHCPAAATTVSGVNAGTAQLLATYLAPNGEYHKASVPIRVLNGTSNGAPVIRSVSGPQQLAVNQVGTWTIDAYDSDGGTLQYVVDWGDFPFGTDSRAPQAVSIPSATLTHSYASVGIYTVNFRVLDQSGAEARSSLTVRVY